jgi:hypothetical protein
MRCMSESRRGKIGVEKKNDTFLIGLLFKT